MATLAGETVVLPLLRLLAAALAGAAVSVVGGGQLAFVPSLSQTPRGGRDGESSSDAASTTMPAGRTANYTESVLAMCLCGGSGGQRDPGGGSKRGYVLSWYVQSGAFGGALYAVAAGGVFEAVLREHLFGEVFFCWRGVTRGGGFSRDTDEIVARLLALCLCLLVPVNRDLKLWASNLLPAFPTDKGSIQWCVFSFDVESD